MPPRNARPKDLKLPGLRRCCQSHVRDGAYALGEAFLDCASILRFDHVETVARMTRWPEYKDAGADMSSVINTKCPHMMGTDETWITGTQPR